MAGKGNPNPNPPRDGRRRGMTKASAKAHRNLVEAVRAWQDDAPVIMRDFHILIAMGLAAVIRQDPDTGRYSAGHEGDGHPDDIPGGHITPTLSERKDAMRWLADRGYGMPAQSIQIEADIRSHQTQVHAHVNLSALTPAKMLQMRALLGAPTRELASGAAVPGTPPSSDVVHDVDAVAADMIANVVADAVTSNSDDDSDDDSDED